MKARINFRFLGILLGSLLVIAVILFGVHRLQTARGANLVLKLAREAVAAKDMPKAIQHYFRYTKMAPNSVEGVIELGDTLKTLGQYREAFFQYEKALRMDPEQALARRNLVEVALKIKRPGDAKTHLTDHLLNAAPDDPDLQWLLGNCEQQLGQNDSALECFKNAIKADNDNPQIAQDLANLLSGSLSRSAEARKVLDELVANSADKASAFTTRGRWILNQTRSLTSEAAAPLLAEAWNDAQAAISANPKSSESAVLLADVASARQMAAEAIPVIEAAIASNPKVPELYVNAAQLYSQQSDFKKAIEISKAGLRELPGNPDLLWGLANLELNVKDYEATADLISQLRTRKFPQSLVQFLEANLAARNGKWREAATTLEKIRPELLRSGDLTRQADFLLASCYMSIGNNDEEIVTLRRLVSNSPNFKPGRTALADALYRQGRTADAQSEYGQILSQPDAPLPAVLNYARVLLGEALASSSTQTKWAELEHIVELLTKYPEAEIDVTVLRSEVLAGKNQLPEAEKVLLAGVKKHPKSELLRQSLISLYSRTKVWQRAATAIDELAQVTGDTPIVRLERGRLLLLENGNKAPKDTLEQLALAPENWKREDKDKLASGYASLYLAVGEFARAESQARLLAEAESGQNNLQVQQLLFELALRSSNVAMMHKALERVNRIEGNGPIWRVGKAIELMLEADMLPQSAAAQRKSNLEQGLSHLAEAAVTRGGWAKIARVQAEIYDRQEQLESAASGYVKAIDLGEKDPQMVARGMYLLVKQGRFVEADKTVRMLQESKTSLSTDIAKVASEVSLRMENYDRALSLAETWSTQSGKPEDKVWLGQVYAVSGRNAEAQKAFREAISADPKSPAGWIALVQFFARSQDIEAAKKSIEEAKVAMGDTGGDTIAQCYEAIRDFRQSEAYYLEALNKQPEDWKVVRRLCEFYITNKQTDQALPLLERLCGPSPAIAEVDRTWARRSLATLWSMKTDAALVRKALALIELNLKQSVTLEDRRVKAMALSGLRDPASVQQSLKMFEEIVKESTTFVLKDNRILAELYRFTNDWQKYFTVMRAVMANGGADMADVVRAHAEALQQHGEANEARIWINRLKTLAPRETSTATLEANLLFDAGDYAALMRLLTTASQEEDKQRWVAVMAERYASSLRSLGKDGEAKPLWTLSEECWTKETASQPDKKHVFAAFLTRKGEIPRAIEAVDKDSLSVEQVVQIVLSGIEAWALNEQDTHQLIAFAKPFYDKHPENISLGIGMGDLYGWVGDWKSSSEAYQRVLEREPSNLAALNNMASILAYTRQNLPEAHSAIDRALKTYEKNPSLIDTRGVVHLWGGDPKSAEADFRASIQAQPHPVKQFHLAQALSAQGKSAEAQAALREAQKQGLSAATLHPLERPALATLTQ